ncbi:acyl-CoA dehydrogenase family protein [Actinacidiphila glaucinigra]|uniref:acyl-CoA dehydrogenase family protein n=1 Tax=Actinacidiphila glaucinigra TaxID=235986 RepID=UPI003D8A6311
MTASTASSPAPSTRDRDTDGTDRRQGAGAVQPATGTLSVSLTCELFLGRMRWDLLARFPEQDPEDRATGDLAVAEFSRLLREHVDPEAVERSRRLPEEAVKALRDGRYHRLMVDRERGGLGLSPYNAFRLISTAATWSTAVSLIMTADNGFGASGYLPLLAEGPLRDLLDVHARTGGLSGSADTEPDGAANMTRRTIAVETDGGTHYLLTGEKVFIGNAPVADLLEVTAQVTIDGVEQPRSFFVDMRAPGVEVLPQQDFMGMRGAPIGALRFTGVRVPREHMLDGSDFERPDREVQQVGYLGRTFSVAAPSLGIARLALSHAREFVSRRTVGGRPLASYDEIQRRLADSLAQTYAIDSLTRWTLLGTGADTLHEHPVLKNVASLACWDIVDRTLGLLGAEGFETAESKARRGAQPLSAERSFRDARGLRISGGVDFLIDYLSARARLTQCHYDRSYSAHPVPVTPDGTSGAPGNGDEMLQDHVRFVTETAEWFGRVCRELSERHPDRESLFGRQRVLVDLSQAANELITLAVVLARSSRPAPEGGEEARRLAALHGWSVRRRIAALRAGLEEESATGHGAVSAQWMDAGAYPKLLADIVL